MNLEDQFKEETGNEPKTYSRNVVSPTGFDFYSDEYVWWLEQKLESNVCGDRRGN
jgi:hypothetical protein